MARSRTTAYDAASRLERKAGKSRPKARRQQTRRDILAAAIREG